MELDKFSTEELKLKLACTTDEIDMIDLHIQRLRNNLKEARDNELAYQTEIDKREIEYIIDASFEQQLEYFLSNYSMNRSSKHIRTSEKFFDMLSVKVHPGEKTVCFSADIDFIKANYNTILQYLPRMFEFCYEHFKIDTNIYIARIKVENNYMVDRITYYPDTKSYFTDGVYIRSHSTLESVLDHMLEIA